MKGYTEVTGGKNTIKCVVPKDTYFIVEYTDGEIINGTGLANTGWDNVGNDIYKISYHLSTGINIEIPNIFKEYLHLVEVSQAVLDAKKIYHFVYIKCKTIENTVIDYRISLKEDYSKGLKIGDVLVFDSENLKSKHWKKSIIG